MNKCTNIEISTCPRNKQRIWKLCIKISVDLNWNCFLFRSQVHYNVYNKLELTDIFLYQRYFLKSKVGLGLTLLELDQRISAEHTID